MEHYKDFIQKNVTPVLSFALFDVFNINQILKHAGYVLETVPDQHTNTIVVDEKVGLTTASCEEVFETQEQLETIPGQQPITVVGGDEEEKVRLTSASCGEVFDDQEHLETVPDQQPTTANDGEKERDEVRIASASCEEVFETPEQSPTTTTRIEAIGEFNKKLWNLNPSVSVTEDLDDVSHNFIAPRKFIHPTESFEKSLEDSVMEVKDQVNVGDADVSSTEVVYETKVDVKVRNFVNNDGVSNVASAYESNVDVESKEHAEPKESSSISTEEIKENTSNNMSESKIVQQSPKSNATKDKMVAGDTNVSDKAVKNRNDRNNRSKRKKKANN